MFVLVFFSFALFTYSAVPEVQLTADTEGQLCEDGSQGREVQEKMINTRDLQVQGVSDALWK